MYPGKHNSSDFVFVKKLVDEFARQGHNCVVICPFNFLHYHKLFRGKDVYEVDGGNKVEVIRPNYISASNFQLGKTNLSSFLHAKAVNRAFKKMEKSGFVPDVVYCHFWSSGLEAFPYVKKKSLPLFIASGESSISMDNTDGHLNDFCNYVKGVICVSSKNRDESVTHKLTLPEKCIVAPNAINDSFFHKRDKSECRNKLKFSQEKFIIAFVGWFIDRKGPIRIAEAINDIESDDVYSLFIGSGEQNPDCKNILFKGKIDNSDLPIYLNAADVFVLPTLHEGCCNAIVEALSCGLPIISSNLPFNWDVLNDRNSIMVDPNDIDEIKNAIVTLKNNSSLRQAMAAEALESARNLTICKRANNIVDFMQKSI